MLCPCPFAAIVPPNPSARRSAPAYPSGHRSRHRHRGRMQTTTGNVQLKAANELKMSESSGGCPIEVGTVARPRPLCTAHRARASGAAGDGPCHRAFCPRRATTIIIGRTIIADVFVGAVFVFSLVAAATSSGEQRGRRGRRCAPGASRPLRLAPLVLLISDKCWSVVVS